MENDRYLACLAADVARLRAVSTERLDAPVPSCPGWAVRDLVSHVAAVFAHKVACLRAGAAPDPWPPPPTGEPPLDQLDAAYADLTAEFDRRRPDDPTYTFYPADGTVGFWIRRMAQEAAVHRVDAEQAVGEVTPIPADLAVDGVAEFLTVFVGWGVRAFREYGELGPLLAGADRRVTALRCGDAGWLVRVRSDGVYVAGDPGAADLAQAAATVSGEPSDVLRWLWGRAGDDAVSISGDPALVTQLREVSAAAGQ